MYSPEPAFMAPKGKERKLPIWIIPLIFLSMFSNFISAQQATCPWLADFSINIVPKLPGSTPTNPGCPTPDCDELMYEVYITTNASYTSFEYSWLSIQARINTNGTSSYIETALSRESCSPAWNAAQFSVENDPAGFGLVTLNLGDPFNTSYPSSLGQAIPLTNGSALLFTIVIHAPAGSPVTWQNPSTGSNPYISVYAKNVQFGSSCAGELAVNYGGAISPNITMPVPGSCTGGAGYFVDVPQQMQTYQGNFLDAVPIPIILTGLTPGTILEELEVVALVKTQNYMEFGNVVSDLLPCTGGILDPDNCSIKIRDYESGGYKYREISALAQNVTVNSAHDLLLKIYLLGPLNESIGDCAEMTIQSLRIKQNGVCCSVPHSTANGYPSATICYQGSPVCPEFDLAVTDLTSGNDCEIKYRVALNWSYQQASFNIEELRFRLRFAVDGPLNVSALNNSLCANCLTITSPTQGLYEATVNLTNTLVNKGSGFDLVFSSTDGCVTGFLFLESTIDVVGSPKCVPELLPPYTTGNYSRCFARLAGNLFYKSTQDCADYLINAKPVSGAGSNCEFNDILENGNSPWSFCACKTGFPYTVTCSRISGGGWLDNVSTFDLVLMSKHILGTDPFNNTFKEVAADIDCNGVVATFDIVELRKLLLGIYTTFPNGVPSYKILGSTPPTQYPAPNPPYSASNPNPYCQSSLTKIINSASDNVNFYSVKTGDVSWANDSSPISCFTSDNAEDRINSTLPVRLTNSLVPPGQILRIPIILDQNDALAAWQCALHFDPTRMQYIGFIPGNTNGEIYAGATDADEGILRLLWYEQHGQEIPMATGEALCYLDFYVSTEISHTELELFEEPDGLKPLAYEADGRAYHLTAIANSETGPTIRVFPNPFGQNIWLNINVPHDGKATLSICDALGNIVSEQGLDLKAGSQKIQLESADLGHNSGYYHLTLRTVDGIQTVKLLKL